ncbi:MULTISPECIES: S1 domain-containing RNA-binding protein [Aerococcus]|uniref:S1 domain-containing RNA-binding protein n=1 Tax=Aerococcus mictus TaxID=2976810 RepID=A0A1E9PQR3_9LACT|nr:MULTISPECIES: S1 domain-containing RNA-binding protein [Aerococcus]KAA9232595.1 RNA-binding protein S1 [Aerococcus mictus]KAA9291099.1 RNA-binding protein S1 [Aerococcus mictus]MBU5610473.1 RNA-binding protein S1 [Aerococcus urinae]MCY3035049.1 S1 domain-containing RNA-binding protein [Aerococcus mictus]MCY3064475.1 S1 domain-containing RNA-binding protein [Aerococcus mictus]
MTVEVGEKVTGKVTGIVKFGVFVDLGDGTSGLVHISEISDSYIKDINDYLQKGDEVTAIVTKIQPDGKIALSMKDAKDHKQAEPKAQAKHGNSGPKPAKANNSHKKFDRKPQAKTSDFDAMMNNFLKESDDRLTSLKRNTEGKRGGRGGRRG